MNNFIWLTFVAALLFIAICVLAAPTTQPKPESTGTDPRDELLNEIEQYIRDYDEKLDGGDDPQPPTGDDYNNVATHIAHLLSARRRK